MVDTLVIKEQIYWQAQRIFLDVGTFANSKISVTAS